MAITPHPEFGANHNLHPHCVAVRHGEAIAPTVSALLVVGGGHNLFAGRWVGVRQMWAHKQWSVGYANQVLIVSGHVRVRTFVGVWHVLPPLQSQAVRVV